MGKVKGEGVGSQRRGDFVMIRVRVCEGPTMSGC